MSRWAFVFLLYYICVLFTQPQHRFRFLIPYHLADLSVMASLVLHGMSSLRDSRPIIRFGPGTVTALLLMFFAYLSLYVGALQVSSRWNEHIDILFKSVVIIIMVEAMAFSAQRAWAVQATMLVASLWWVKGGLRLIQAGSTYSGDRISGLNVGMIENPNTFAYFLCVMIPIYLFFYQQAPQK